MSDIIQRRIRESIGKEIKIFLKNNFRYAGKVIDGDDEVIEILDYVSGSYKIITIAEIRDLEVKG